MAATVNSLSSSEAHHAFKTKISDALSLLQFMNEMDKSEIWKFWKTISSAVKIAVSGKGNIISMPKTTKELQWHQKEADYEHMKNSDQNSLAFCLPHDRSSGNDEKYEVIVNDNTTSANYTTSLKCGALSRELPEGQEGMLSENFKTLKDEVNQAGLPQPTSSISISDLNCQNSAETGSENDILHQFQCTENDKPKKDVRKNTVIWPVRRPTTRSVAKILSPQTTAKNCQKQSQSQTSVPHLVKDSDKQVNIKERLVNFHSTENEHKGDYDMGILPIDVYDVMPIIDKNKGDVGGISNGTRQEQGFIDNHQSNLILEQRVSVSQQSDLQNHEVDLQSSNLNSRGDSQPVVTDFKPDDEASTTQLMQIKIEDSEITGDPQQIKLEMNPNVQNFHMQDRLNNKSTSDIETIISALEAELRKNGNDVGLISITAGQEIAAGVMSHSCDSAIQHISGQEVEEIQNNEQVIWSPDRNIHPISPQPVNDTATVDGTFGEGCNTTPQIDAEYDVVEYEVLADKEKTSSNRGRKKKSKNLCQQNDEFDRTCPMCHRVLTYASSMAAHMRIHTGDRPYSCGQCDRKFTTKANRDRHEATHIGLKPFKCTECDKSFTEKRSLKIHMRSHTGERPFVCTICGRGFAQKCTLLVHMDKHMNKKGHLCDLCGKAFRQKSQLDIHVKRHNRQANYPCTECSVKCYTRGDLMRHMIKHTGARPFHCSLCSRTFTRKQYLMDHENTHYGRKPYKCRYCSQTFHDMGSCHRHIRKHKQEEDEANGLKSKKTMPLLSSEDFNIILKGSQTGQVLTLEDGTKALLKVVESEADGSIVYHISCLDNDTSAQKFEADSLDQKADEKCLVSFPMETSASTSGVHNIITQSS